MKEQISLIKIFIDSIESKYEKFWETLVFIKEMGSNEEFLDRMVNFQYELAICLSSVNDEYAKIAKSLKAIRRGRDPKAENKTPEEDLQSCLEALKQLIYIGKSFGDAFAWFFYQNERKMLNKHIERQEEFLMPSGIQGRMGEIEFVKNMKMIEGNIVIYHGITSILRIRDVSLINLASMKLTAIGELKSRKKTDNELTVSMYAFGPKAHMKSLVKETKIKPEKAKEEREESASFQERLNKQIKDLVEALKIYSEQTPKNDRYIYGNQYFKQLECLVKENDTCEKATYKKASEGMLFLAVRPMGKKLSDRLFEEAKKTWFDKTELMNSLLTIIDTKSQNNGKRFGSIHYRKDGKINFIHGTKPLFWLPIPIDIIKQIYFKSVNIITIYNPLFLINEMEKRGFAYEYVDRLKKKCFVKKDSLPKLTLDHFNYFISLIGNHLVDEKSVINSIDAMLEQIKSIEGKVNSKMELEFYQE